MGKFSRSLAHLLAVQLGVWQVPLVREAPGVDLLPGGRYYSHHPRAEACALRVCMMVWPTSMQRVSLSPVALLGGSFTNATCERS